ncbi:PEGA domain-containing protein [Candidatus Dojkabacteria bacterium]|uniref:PEGA domain-containing protein n=1 Tax=Candidatus Dojkabacteria bacterium TaxID=2099670 RepID=A0A955LBD9_9BACT|nr:PEGA domain-containing protein [Candidatus Dojkabacteria bacterium]
MIKSNNSYRGYLLIILVILFFVTALSVFILLIQGKKITPSGQIIETGVVRLLSDVGDIKVYLNGKEVSRSNNLVQNVPIGKNTILVRKAGFSDWEKVIKVDSSKVLELTARLYPEEFNIDQITSLNINSFGYSSDLSNMYFTVTGESEEENGIWRINLSNGIFDFGSGEIKPQKIFAFNIELTNSLKEEHLLSVSPDGSSVLIETSLNKKYIWSAQKPNELIDLEVDLGFKATKIAWFTSNSIIVFNNDVLFERRLNSEENRLITYQPQSNITYCNGSGFSYWIGKETGTIYRYQNGDSVQIPLFEDAKDLGSITSLECLNNINEVVVEDSQGYYFIDFATNFIDRIARDVEITNISADGNTIIYKDVATWYSYNIKDISGTDTFDTQTYLLESVPYNNTAYIVDGGNTLAIFDRNVENKNLLLLSDIDGENVNNVLKNVTLGNGKAAMMQSDRKKLFVVIKESNTDGTTSSMLYVVDLTK